MIYYQCKCGEAKYYGSGMSPRDCEGCKKCGTTFAQSPTGHKSLAAHDFNDKRTIEDGIETDESFCRKCYKARRHLNK